MDLALFMEAAMKESKEILGSSSSQHQINANITRIQEMELSSQKLKRSTTKKWTQMFQSVIDVVVQNI